MGAYIQHHYRDSKMTNMLRSAVLATVVTLGAASAAHATFVLDTSCGVSSCAAGTKFFIDVANSDVSTFGGTVGISGPAVTVDTTGNVDTGSGFATITPVDTLTDLIFTPADDTLFNDFSFRGQIEKSGFTGTVDVTWTDSSGTRGTITFTGVKGPNADFARLGIVSLDGETLKSVEISTPGSESFKEFKQVEFSFAVAGIPEPATWAMMTLGFAGLGFAGYRRAKTSRTALSAA
jgi:hypothetical protein